MATLIMILKNKGFEVSSVSSDTPVSECLRLMKEKNIGSIVVMDGDQIKGLFTEKAAVRALYNDIKHCILDVKPVSEAMEKELVCVTPETTVEEAMSLFTNKRTRHLPVLEEGKLIGLVSIGDVTKWLLEQQKSEIAHLSDYISGESR